MKVIANIIKYMLVIVLTISIILTVAIHTITSTILNKDYILGKLEETNYYNNIYNQVESNFENYIYQSGLDEEVLKNIISEEDIKSDTTQIISNIYDGKTSNIDVSKIEKRLETNIYNSLSNQRITESTKKAIDQFINKITEEYKDTIVHTKYETNINKVLSKIIKYGSIIKNILIVASIVIGIILLLLNIKNIFRGCAQLGIALLATGFFNIIVNIIINTKVKIDNITVLNNGFSMTLRNIIHDVIKIFMNYSFILLAVGLLIIVISNIIVNKDKKEEKLN